VVKRQNRQNAGCPKLVLYVRPPPGSDREAPAADLGRAGGLQQDTLAERVNLGYLMKVKHHSSALAIQLHEDVPKRNGVGVGQRPRDGNRYRSAAAL
jgi:hypothetical protein